MSPRQEIERAALSFLRANGRPACIERSEIRRGVIVLRDADGRVLQEIIDGLEVTEDPVLQRAGIADVLPFRLEIRCWSCARRWLRPSTEYVPGELTTCPRCGCANVMPRDPVSASRG